MPVFGISSVEPRFSSAAVLVIEQSRKKSRPTSCGCTTVTLSGCSLS